MQLALFAVSVWWSDTPPHSQLGKPTRRCICLLHSSTPSQYAGTVPLTCIRAVNCTHTAVHMTAKSLYYKATDAGHVLGRHKAETSNRRTVRLLLQPTLTHAVPLLININVMAPTVQPANHCVQLCAARAGYVLTTISSTQAVCRPRWCTTSHSQYYA